MLGALVALLRPVFVPLLKVDFRAPHLPEGTHLVRHLRPTTAWLKYRYLTVVLSLSTQLFAALLMAVILPQTAGRWGAVVSFGAVALVLAILGFMLVVARVDFELRHYLVGDRSLRVSQGAISQREVTLSYANVQNIEVTQGPLERVFGFKNLIISTAGASAPTDAKGMPSMHQVRMMGLENADELRALVLGMLEQTKDQGLGDGAHHDGFSMERLAEVRDAALALRNAALAAKG
jgi:membrane protein YdbS with pleckstrin-like domain